MKRLILTSMLAAVTMFAQTPAPSGSASTTPASKSAASKTSKAKTHKAAKKSSAKTKPTGSTTAAAK
jgi:hypothetical protein